MESKDLTNTSLATLFGNHQEHEIELMRLNQHEENDKKKKGIALKASSSIHEESGKEDMNEQNNLEEDDDLSLFVKRFNKFLRNKEIKGDRTLVQRRKEKIPSQFQNAMNAINLYT